MKIKILSISTFLLLQLSFYLPICAQITHDSFGGWLEMDGVNDYATIADNSSLDIGNGATDDFTIECFFYFPDTNITGTRTLIFKNASYGLYLILSNTAQDRIIFRINYSSVGTDYYYTAYFLDFSAGWHHIAASYDNEYSASWDAMQVFLDGTKIVDASNFEITPGVYNSTGTFYVGSGNGLNTFYEIIDEVRISDILRYSGSTYTVPTTPFTVDANTRALWHFDETAGSTSFYDETTNANTLSAVNGAQSLPVEIELFTANSRVSDVELHWRTATEVNNHGFEIERNTMGDMGGKTWNSVGFVEGAGTNSLQKEYSYTDKNLSEGKYFYRLKQIDQSGTIKYSQVVEVEIAVAKKFALGQNYPNPFNPTTSINYQLPMNSYVTLKVYNLLGCEVATLVNEKKEAGNYSVQWNASAFSTGIYFYRLQAGSFSVTNKLMLLK